MADRAAEIRSFLATAGWQTAVARPLAGDASARRYLRLIQPGGGSAVLMDDPPGPDGGSGSAPTFAGIAAHLRALGLSAPEVLAADLPAGLLLVEDLGDGLYTRLIDAEPRREAPLYAAAVEALAMLQAAPPPPGLPDLSAADWARAAALVFETYAPAGGADIPAATARAAEDALAEALATHADGPRVTILRDVHAGNLIWLPERPGAAAVGLLDFQDAQMGQPGYDLVSLVQDARRDVTPATEDAMLRRLAERTGRTLDDLTRAHHVLGVQRALRILGVFARLATRDGKTAYLAHLPRVWQQLQTNLARPELVPLARHLAVLPPPGPAVLARMRAA